MLLKIQIKVNFRKQRIYNQIQWSLKCSVQHIFKIFMARTRMKKKRRFLQGSESKDSDDAGKSERKSISEVVSLSPVCLFVFMVCCCFLIVAVFFVYFLWFLFQIQECNVPHVSFPGWFDTTWELMTKNKCFEGGKPRTTKSWNWNTKSVEIEAWRWLLLY